MKGKITADWLGVAVAPLEYEIAVESSGSLLFRADAAWPAVADDHPPGTFVEGLWERDVAELFLRDPETGRYQEFNVSPSGAWWSAVFTSYRNREKTVRPPSLVPHAVREPERWSAGFRCLIRDLEIPWNTTTEFHVSAIRTGGATHFLSSSPLPELDPDFHEARAFRAINLSLK